MVIDSHQHIWEPNVEAYWWMSGEAASLKRPFTIEDFKKVLGDSAVEAGILVQTWHSFEETQHFLKLAANTPQVAGVVGWVDLTKDDVRQRIQSLKTGSGGEHLVAIRHLVHDEADADWLLRSDVQRGLAAVEAEGLAYDLLIKPREIAAALRTVTTFAKLRFVIDHIAKPNIKDGEFEGWSAEMEKFRAHRGHVWCKLSGMATEANRASWKSQDLLPYVLRIIEIFGADRCMYGSDWPVSNLAGSYQTIVDALRKCVASLSAEDQESIFSRSAIGAYRLDPSKFASKRSHAEDAT